MPVIIEHIGGAIITVSDGSTLRSIYLPESELRGLYESLMVFYGDFKNTGNAGYDLSLIHI
jgi:hypothetical protein